MKLKYDYSALDAAILAAVTAGKPGIPKSREILLASIALQKQDEAGRNYPNDAKPAWRFVDCRLQALRKAGKIKFVGKIWRLE